MSETFDYIDKYTKNLKGTHSQRVADQDNYLDDYLMNWSEESMIKQKVDGIKIVKSPDVRNRILGANRLLCVTDAAFSVPKEMNSEDVMDIADELEGVADRIFRAASRVAMNPINYDVALSLNLFGEVHIGITRTADLLEHANRKDKTEPNQVAIYRLEEIARVTPYLLEVWEPRNRYPDLDRLGLRAYYQEISTTVGDVLDEFGEDAREHLDDPENRWATVTLKQLWDWKYRYVWVGSEDFLYMESHDLPFIPITVHLGEGSMLFDDPEDQRQPMGYTTTKSGLNNMQNLALTLGYDNMYKMGINPNWISTQGSNGEYAVPDFSVRGGVWKVPQGGSLVPADLRNVVNPVLMEMANLADQKVQESTIFSQTLGEPMGRGTPFSTVALLHQAGRLPLLMPQKKGGWAIADAVKKALVWMKLEPPKGVYKHILGDMDVADIPKHFELEATLDVSLPQDDVQNATIAGKLTEGDNPKVSNAWILENILKVRQPGAMQEEIWEETAANLDARRYFLDQLARIQEQEDAMMMSQDDRIMAKVQQMMAAAAQQAPPAQGGPTAPAPPGPPMPEQPIPEQQGPLAGRMPGQQPMEPMV